MTTLGFDGHGVRGPHARRGEFLIRLGGLKTDQEGRGLHVPVLGRAAAALRVWLDAAAITHGPIFRGVAKGGRLAGRLSDRAVAPIVQRRAHMAGFDATAFGAHSLRAGFITESGRQHIPLGDAKALSGHRSDAVAMGYYRSGSATATASRTPTSASSPPPADREHQRIAERDAAEHADAQRVGHRDDPRLRR